MSRDFLPLDDEGLRLSGRIDDTCEDCASVLAAAAAVAAAEIRSKPDNARRADEVGRMLRSERERRQAYRKAQDEALSEVARRFRR